MKRLLLCIPFALAACAETGTEMPMVSSGTIQTADQFAGTIVGKKLAFGDSDTVTINADGTITGNFGGNALAGTWEFRDGAWCRVITTGQGPGGEDCQLWEVTEEGFKVTRDRGKGRSFTYTLAG